MIAGTLAILEESVEDALESQFAGGSRLPALDVAEYQETLDGRPIQSGKAADVIHNQTQTPSVGVDATGDPTGIVTGETEVSEHILADWVADVTGTGLIAASSVEGESIVDFPWALFHDATGVRPTIQRVDVAKLHRHWSDEDVLGDVWLNATDYGDGSTIGYHADADGSEPATIGLGFKHPWGGIGIEGVVYESGYLAAYNCSKPTDFVQFVEEELLQYCYAEGEEDAKKLNDGEKCEGCGRESDTIEDGLCIVCRDKKEEEQAEDDSQTTIEDLDTVNVADGGEDDG